jgi:lysyl-tRNA synthetase class I
MSETVILTIPFDFLLQAIAQLNTDDNQRLWEFLDEQLHDDEIGDAEEEAEVAVAYAEYEAGDFVTLDKFLEERSNLPPEPDQPSLGEVSEEARQIRKDLWINA